MLQIAHNFKSISNLPDKYMETQFTVSDDTDFVFWSHISIFLEASGNIDGHIWLFPEILHPDYDSKKISVKHIDHKINCWLQSYCFPIMK